MPNLLVFIGPLGARQSIEDLHLHPLTVYFIERINKRHGQNPVLVYPGGLDCLWGALQKSIDCFLVGNDCERRSFEVVTQLCDCSIDAAQF